MFELIAMSIPAGRQYRYLDVLINIYVVVLIISNLIAPKPVAFYVPLLSKWIGPLTVSAAEMLFPITYIFGDVFTEVYGYGAGRRAIWIGFLASGIMAAIGVFAVWLPPAPEFKDQAAYAIIFGVVPRNVAGSLLAYWCGEFANSVTMAKMKLMTNGRLLWTRTIGSTIVGEGVDTTVVVLVIFWGSPVSEIVNLILSAYIFKVVYEVVMTPATYWVVNTLKRREGVDFFDRSTNLNPFAIGAPVAPVAIQEE